MFYSKEYEPNIFWSVSTTAMFWSEIINSNYINAEMNQNFKNMFRTFPDWRSVPVLTIILKVNRLKHVGYWPSVRSRWLVIGLFCVFMDRNLLEIHTHMKRKRGQYPAILTEQGSSVRVSLYGTTSCGTQWESRRGGIGGGAEGLLFRCCYTRNVGLIYVLIL